MTPLFFDPKYLPFAEMAEAELTRLQANGLAKLGDRWFFSNVQVRPFERLFNPVKEICHPDAKVQFVRSIVYMEINGRLVCKIGLEGYRVATPETSLRYKWRPGRSYLKNFQKLVVAGKAPRFLSVDNQTDNFITVDLSTPVLEEIEDVLSKPHRFFKNRLPGKGCPRH